MRTYPLGIVIGLVISTMSLGPVQAEAIPRAEHPRPDFRRDEWLNLNGDWQFRFDPEDVGLKQRWHKSADGFDRTIVVPFPWESKLSKIADTSGQKIGWYRRTVAVPKTFRDQRVWLRFGAVDWEAKVWVNGREAGSHEGGYTPFALDITEMIEPGQETAIVVRALDATDKELPIGKQIGHWYTSTSGIWQTVWLEARPATYVDRLRLTPSHRGELWSLTVELEAAGPDGQVDVELTSPDKPVRPHRETIQIADGRGRMLTSLEIRNPKPWSPESPHLYDLEIRLRGSEGTIDTVRTYFGLRTVGRGRHRDVAHESILLNGKPIYLRGALDQSFNPDGLYTAPSDAFLRRDMELAKQAGFNFLRIHIKSEEPRRLYWADRLGVLIMEDIPCTWQQSPRARQAWESTMRATIARDINHPSIFAWCLFNETWGLGGNGFRDDANTQQWVLDCWTEVKRLDPSRLVEDNSPCLYDHVKTDLNSWHFYIDDYVRAREHIEGVVRRARPGSQFNFVPGHTSGTEPLLNSEYGAVSAGGGDRDVSWGFRHLTTQLRRHEAIQGYVYTELSDIEWEHNGIYEYDRSSKTFGYDAFVPGMTVADLQGADFVGFDAPPAIETTSGEELVLPVFISHFSQRKYAPRLVSRVVGVNSLGRPVTTEPQSVRAVWRPYRVTFQEPVRVRLPEGRAMVGAITLELLDEKGQRIAANFVNLIARPTGGDALSAVSAPAMAESPSVEVLGSRLVAVRFDPGAFASFRTDDEDWDWLNDRGKFWATGACEVEYHVALPAFVRNAIPSQVVWMAEMAAKADTERLDWPAVRRAADYPQTQARTYPGKASVHLAGHQLWELELPDDPADARGVLSHHARFHHGSYGYLVRKRADLMQSGPLRDAVREQEHLKLTIRAEDAHGLALFGRRLGQYPIDPTLIIQTARDLDHPPGWTSVEPVTVHRLRDESRLVHALRTGEDGGHEWRYTTKQPGSDWRTAEFDDSAWQKGPGGFGTQSTPAVKVKTPWQTPDLWLRTQVDLSTRPAGIVVRYFHDEDLEIYVNGKRLLKEEGYLTDYRQRPLTKAETALFHPGKNTIAVHCRQTQGGQGFDLGLRWLKVEGED